MAELLPAMTLGLLAFVGCAVFLAHLATKKQRHSRS